MARTKDLDKLATLQMALVGYQIERQRIEEKIREIQAQLKGKHVETAAVDDDADAAPARKRMLSPAARRRIAAAQRKRWAEHRKRLAQGTKPE